MRKQQSLGSPVQPVNAQTASTNRSDSSFFIRQAPFLLQNARRSAPVLLMSIPHAPHPVNRRLSRQRTRYRVLVAGMWYISIRKRPHLRQGIVHFIHTLPEY